MRAVAEFFETHAVKYAVVGSVAGLSHGYSRFTIDIDVLVDFPQALVPEFAAKLDGEYYVDDRMIMDAIRHHSSFNLLHFETGIKLDFFTLKPSAFDQSVLERRQIETMYNEQTAAFYVQSAEDLVLSKLVWYRKGGGTSDRQWSDILAVLKIQQLSLDFAYLEKWARELRIEDLLTKALDEAGLSEQE